jgi:hypothetical protein
MGKDLVDPRRSEPAANANERDMLEDWLNYHRVTLLLKCEGLDEVKLNTRPIPTSALSLHQVRRETPSFRAGRDRRILSCIPPY